ncbi:MAG: hypothetical protein EBR55_04005 [Chitinophagia bacterium]|nr:hypothetical protein [Chitinophagia bacterium]
MDPKKEALVEHLLLQGAINIEGLDPSTGETLYTVTDKMQEVSPDIYYELKQQFEDHLFELAKMGPIVMQWKIRL